MDRLETCRESGGEREEYRRTVKLSNAPENEIGRCGLEIFSF